MKALTLHDHEVRRLLAAGSVLVMRPVKPQPPEGWRMWGPIIDGHAAWCEHPTQGEKGQVVEVRCPYGAPGDTAWVRETWMRQPPDAPDGIWYQADNLARWFDGTDTRTEALARQLSRDGRWRSPVTMPRWASRCAVSVTEVAVRQTTELTPADLEPMGWGDSSLLAYGLWHSAHYGATPWCWVVSVTRTPDKEGVTP